MQKIVDDSGKAFDPSVVEVLKRRHIELEKKAQAASVGTIKLSLDLKIERGAAPAAGFEVSAPVDFCHNENAPADFLGALAHARADIQSVFEGAFQAGSRSLDELLSMLAVRFKQVAPHDAFAVYIIRDEKLHPQYVAGDNFRLFSSLRIPVGQGLSGWVAENRKPILNGNPSVESGYLNNPAVFSTLRSAISVPLVGVTNVIGVLSLYHESKDAFTREQLRLLQSIAPKLALSIESAARVAAAAAEGAEAAQLPDATISIHHLHAELERTRRVNTPLAMILCDADGLSQVQAHLGRAEANSVERGITLAMAEGLREHDFLGRLGPSEYLLVLPGLSLHAVRTKVARLMQIISEKGDSRVAVLAAEALAGEDGLTADELLSVADRRVFQRRQQRIIESVAAARAAAAPVVEEPSRGPWLQ
jgi:diguanylate cyclase (GGDEF)-like protein